MPHGPQISEAEQWTSSSVVLSQVVHGRPTGLLQSVGGRSAAAMTWWWSFSGSERARCPKNLRRRDFILSETRKHPVVLWTVSLVVCLVYGICEIFHRHQVSYLSRILEGKCRKMGWTKNQQARMGIEIKLPKQSGPNNSGLCTSLPRVVASC